MFCIDDRIPSLELYAFNNILSTQKKKKKLELFLFNLTGHLYNLKFFLQSLFFVNPAQWSWSWR